MEKSRKSGSRFGRAVWAVLVALAIGLGAPGMGWAEARINLNEATVEELTSLPGIGPARARAIVERRDEAPFDSADELTDVPGIGPALVEKLRDHVEVGRAGAAGEERQAAMRASVGRPAWPPHTPILFGQGTG